VLPKFRHFKPDTLEEALGLLESHGSEACIIAGGTDLLVGLDDGTVSAGYLIDLKGIPELSEITSSSDGLRIGACVTINQLLESDCLATGYRALRQAASRLATYQIRNRATLGGNLCNASPACDMGPPLLVFDARLRMVSSRGERTIPLRDFFQGVKETCCEPCEIVTEVIVPESEGTTSAFAKRTRIRGHDLALVNGAAACENGSGLRLALGAVAETPLLIGGLGGAEPGDKQRVMDIVLRAVSPIDDVRSSGEYRTAMVGHVVESLLDRLTETETGAQS
jgi:CO/xanthine dehydrogenase FAD-binding subunit